MERNLRLTAWGSAPFSSEVGSYAMVTMLGSCFGSEGLIQTLTHWRPDSPRENLFLDSAFPKSHIIWLFLEKCISNFAEVRRNEFWILIIINPWMIGQECFSTIHSFIESCALCVYGCVQVLAPLLVCRPPQEPIHVSYHVHQWYQNLNHHKF